jgi:prepilin-type N-terminal cleavage/methylation domain-containing protein
MKRPDNKRQGSKAAERNNGQPGFTLLEVMIALVILMVVTLGAASLFVYAINYNSGAYDRTLAHAVAQQQMERLRRTPFDSLVTPAQPEPDITSGGRTYGIVTTVCADAAAGCGGSATLKKITIQITPQGAGPTWVRIPFRLETLRAASALGAYFQQ